jgi:NAD(P)H-flavin reductase
VALEQIELVATDAEITPTYEAFGALIETGTLLSNNDMPALDPADDRVMICGSPTMLNDLSAMLDARGFSISSNRAVVCGSVIRRPRTRKSSALLSDITRANGMLEIRDGWFLH